VPSARHGTARLRSRRAVLVPQPWHGSTKWHGTARHEHDIVPCCLVSCRIVLVPVWPCIPACDGTRPDRWAGQIGRNGAFRWDFVCRNSDGPVCSCRTSCLGFHSRGISVRFGWGKCVLELLRHTFFFTHSCVTLQLLWSSFQLFDRLAAHYFSSFWQKQNQIVWVVYCCQ
jgi:hypothetical protein